MGLTVQIKRKSFFGNKEIDINKVIETCGLNYGSWNDFHILTEGELKKKTFVAYNQDIIGRGIFFDCKKIDNGILEIQINFPTSETEINDFYNIVKELKNQLKNIVLYCVDENKKYKYEEFLQQKNRILEFSFDTLKRQCQESLNNDITYTTAMWPLTISGAHKELFLQSSTLKDFEEFLHSKQNINCYYAKPTLYNNLTNGKSIANYVLTEECLSIFPINGRTFLNFNLVDVTIDEFTITFFMYSEKEMLNEIYDYDKFIGEVMKNSFEYFDSDHIIIPPLTKSYIVSILDRIKKDN